MTDLIIFDCDGTLVDSEYLSAQVTSELLYEAGYTEYTPEECMAQFCGHTWSNIRAMIERKNGPVPEDLIERYIETLCMRMETELKAVPHAHEVLEELHGKYQICVASNGQRDNVMKSLTVTGLMNYFEDSRIFTKIQVENGKPAPDLFLFALDKMGVSAENAIVIEDSVTGVTAARAADIYTYGFTGTGHSEAALLSAGANAILPSLIHISAVLAK